jgi:hypothetical protein
VVILFLLNWFLFCLAPLPNPRGYHHSPRGFNGGKVPLGMFKKTSSTEFIDSGISTVSGQSTNIMFHPTSTQQQRHQHPSSSSSSVDSIYPDRRYNKLIKE